MAREKAAWKQFQSTPPSREATSRLLICARRALFQSTPPSREATSRSPPCRARPTISIHASLAGGDSPGRRRCCWPSNFNPRLPRGRRHVRKRHMCPLISFQSTPPSREATYAGIMGLPSDFHFNPRLPRGRRPSSSRTRYQPPSFQSTPPSREATHSRRSRKSDSSFQSTPPSREATPGR